MSLTIPWIVILALTSLYIQAASSRRLCDKGQLLYSPRYGPDVCIECLAGEFMPEERHTRSQCYSCTEIQDPQLEILDSPCNKTHDTEIHCIDGYYRTQPSYPDVRGQCRKCTKCLHMHTARHCQKFRDTVCCPSFEYGVLINIDGNPECVRQCGPGYVLHTVTQKCVPCPRGTYMDEGRHSHNYCKECQFVRHVNEKIIHPCNSTDQTVIGCIEGFYRQRQSNSISACVQCQNCSHNTDGNIYEGRACDHSRNTVCCPQTNTTVVDTSDGPRCVTVATNSTAETTTTPHLPVCREGEYLFTNARSRSATCRPCPQGSYMDETEHIRRSCKSCEEFPHEKFCPPDTTEHNSSDDNVLTLGEIIGLVVVVALTVLLIAVVPFVILKVQRRQRPGLDQLESSPLLPKTGQSSSASEESKPGQNKLSPDVMANLTLLFQLLGSPDNVLCYFHKYNPRVLTFEDMQHIRKDTCVYGDKEGATTLLKYLTKSDNWLPCLLKVLKDPEVNLAPVAELMIDVLRESGVNVGVMPDLEINEIPEYRQELRDLKEMYALLLKRRDAKEKKNRLWAASGKDLIQHIKKRHKDRTKASETTNVLDSTSSLNTSRSRDIISVKDFKTQDLPHAYCDVDMVDLVKLQADLAVLIGVDGSSQHRPTLIPGTDKPYPYSDYRDRNAQHTGSGWVKRVKMYKDQHCPCKTCQLSVQPVTSWGEVVICTAASVVFDITEGRNSRCYFFYDSPDTGLQSCPSVSGAVKVLSDAKRDWCYMTFVAHNTELVRKVQEIYLKYHRLRREVKFKYDIVRDHIKDDGISQSLEQLSDIYTYCLGQVDSYIRDIERDHDIKDDYDILSPLKPAFCIEDGDIDKREQFRQILSKLYENYELSHKTLEKLKTKCQNIQPDSEDEANLHDQYWYLFHKANELERYLRCLNIKLVYSSDTPHKPRYNLTHPFILIVSHPCGGIKKISLGEVIDRKSVQFDCGSAYLYTNITNDGTEGARVFILGRGGPSDHGHSGTVGKLGESGTWYDIIPYIADLSVEAAE